MIDLETQNHEEKIVKVLERASKLMKDTGFDELAVKWERILQNCSKTRERK